MLYTILCVVFEARVNNLCDRDITTNFGAVAGEVILLILVLLLLFLVAVIVIYISEKKKRNKIFACGGTIHLQQRYCSKQNCLWK